MAVLGRKVCLSRIKQAEGRLQWLVCARPTHGKQGETMKLADFVLLIGFLLMPSWSLASDSAYCHERHATENWARSYIALYENLAYGFTVEIPKGLVGKDEDNPLYQRGFIIVFQDPDESLAVYAGPNSLEWENVDDAAQWYASIFKDHAEKVLSTSTANSVLGNRSAKTVTTRYLCPGSDTRYTSIMILTMSRDKRFEYSLEWVGKPDEESHGVQILKALSSSWRFRKPRS